MFRRAFALCQSRRGPPRGPPGGGNAGGRGGGFGGAPAGFGGQQGGFGGPQGGFGGPQQGGFGGQQYPPQGFNDPRGPGARGPQQGGFGGPQQGGFGGPQQGGFGGPQEFGYPNADPRTPMGGLGGAPNRGGDPRVPAGRDARAPPMAPPPQHEMREAEPEPPKRPSEAPKFLEITEREDGIAVVGLKANKVNSFSTETLVELLTWVHYLGNADNIKGVLLRSSVEGIFSAGYDLNEFVDAQPEKFEAFWSAVQESWMLLTSFPKTMVAEVNGHALGGGCAIAMTADYRIMMKGDGRIGLPEVPVGMTIPPWLINHFTSIVGPRTAERMMQLGETVDAETALRIGLVDEVVSTKEELNAAGEAIMKKFLSVPEQGKWMTKDMSRRELFRFLADEEDRRYDLEFFVKFIQHPDIQKNLKSHLDKLKKK